MSIISGGSWTVLFIPLLWRWDCEELWEGEGWEGGGGGGSQGYLLGCGPGFPTLSTLWSYIIAFWCTKAITLIVEGSGGLPHT